MEEELRYQTDFDEAENIIEEEKTDKEKGNRGLLLMYIQIVISAAAVIAAIIIKLIGGQAYASAGTWFYDNYNNSIFLSGEDTIVPFTDNVNVRETSLINAQIPKPNNNNPESENSHASEN